MFTFKFFKEGHVLKKNNLYKKWRFIRPALIAAFVVIAGITAVAASSSEADGEGGIVFSRDAGDPDDNGGNLKIKTGNDGNTNTSETSCSDGSLQQTTDAAEQGSTDTSQGTEYVNVQETFAVVYICGEVHNPGLYKCSPESRIADVVQMAGGLKPEADDTCVNMAAKVTDAQQIVIFKKGEQPQVSAAGSANASSSGSASSSQSGGLVNINTADETLLKTLPGIGEQKAKAIISYRQDGGSFSRIEDIMKVPGIKDGAFNKIRDMITV